ncbi:hypothetical protein [Mesorhizobium sp. 1B3]|uniref:hypothetical protein n=1 Tax=Mesorhizobium sp. 1B3 TaxID=3243599 RepID=UPI003D9578B5
MAISRKEEARALDADERELVDKSHQPEIQNLSDKDLTGLVKHLRERRDKAQTIAHQRRREMRGKGKARGATPSKADGGSQLKLAVLAMAMRRTNGEVERRRQLAAQMELAENARRALAMKETASRNGTDFNTRHAHQGMRAVANEKAKNLVRPMEAGRQRKAGKVAQAKRDAV